MRYRIPLALIATVVALFAVGASAYAFECYNTQRSAQGNAAAGANSQALLSLERILSDPDIVGSAPPALST